MCCSKLNLHSLNIEIYYTMETRICFHFFSFLTDPDGKTRQIYYKADQKGYHVSYDSKFNGFIYVFMTINPENSHLEPFEFSGESQRLTDLSNSYLPPSQNLIRDVLTPSNEYLPPKQSNTYLPPN